jgi:hypothetical protein
MKDPMELKNISFLNCYSQCKAVRLLGVGECEIICPEKFKNEKENKNENRYQSQRVKI